jgi:hypothetical protein
MTIIFHPDPEKFLGKGVVFIAWIGPSPEEDVAEEGHYAAYWELFPDGPPTPLEQAPTSTSTQEMLEWGLHRTPKVLIRPRTDPGEYYWAGSGERPEKYRDLQQFEL